MDQPKADMNTKVIYLLWDSMVNGQKVKLKEVLNSA